MPCLHVLLSAYATHKHSETLFSREIGFSASWLFGFRLLSDPEKLSKSVVCCWVLFLPNCKLISSLSWEVSSNIQCCLRKHQTFRIWIALSSSYIINMLNMIKLILSLSYNPVLKGKSIFSTEHIVLLDSTQRNLLGQTLCEGNSLSSSHGYS